MPVLNNIFTADGRFHIAYGTTTYTKLLAPCLRVGFILSSIFAQSGYLLDKENFESIYNKLVVFSGTIIGEYKALSPISLLIYQLHSSLVSALRTTL